MLTYLLHSSLCLLFFYGLYEFLLRRLTYFQLNRWYLLSTLLLSFVLPLYPWFQPAPEQEAALQPVTYTLQAVEYSIEKAGGQAVSTGWEMSDFIRLGYLILAGLFLGRMGLGLWRIGQLVRRGEIERHGFFSLVWTREGHKPFSFLRFLFWSRHFEVPQEDRDQILQHELAHIRQMHSVDILLSEAAIVLLWWNPVTYFYKRALQEVHEYLADASVLKKNSVKKYGHLLLRQAQSGPSPALAHAFHSQIKKRIIMMTKTKSGRRALFRYLPALILLPALALVLSAGQVSSRTLSDVLPTIENRDFDPEIVRAKFSTILNQRFEGEVSPFKDQEISNELARACYALRKKYPEHVQDIHRILREVAAEQQAELHFAEGWFKKLTFRDAQAVQKIGEELYTKAPVMPRFPGCEEVEDAEAQQQCADKKMLMFVYGQVKYPAQARENGIEGKVVASVVIDKTGSVTQPKILKEPGYGLGAEVLRVIGQMPDWIPGEDMDGRPTNVQLYIPVHFKLEGKEEKAKAEGFEGMELPDFSKMDDREKRLYIIDGHELSKEEKVEFLKKGSFVAETITVIGKEEGFEKYGEKGKHGVVIIETREGHEAEKPEEVIGFNGREEVFKVVENMPRFPGCEDIADRQEREKCAQKKMLTFLYENLKYPVEAREAGKEGMVVVEMIIDEKGWISTAQLLRDPGYGMGKEALRVVKLMNELPERWIPGEQGGKVVKVMYNLPIRFKLPDHVDKAEERTHPVQKAHREASAQEDLTTEDKSVFRVVEEMPRFPSSPCEEMENAKERERCAQKAMLEFLYTRLTYPEEARRAGASGMAVVQFVVNEDGSLSDYKVIRDPDYGMGQEALRVVKLMNEMPERWIPGKQRGEVVKVMYNLPIRFKLAPQEEKLDLREESLSSQLELTDFSLSPNPNKGTFTLSFQSTSASLQVEVLTLEGRQVWLREYPDFDGTFRQAIQLNDAPAGQLMLVVTQEGKRYVEAFVIQN